MCDKAFKKTILGYFKISEIWYPISNETIEETLAGTDECY